MGLMNQDVAVKRLEGSTAQRQFEERQAGIQNALNAAGLKNQTILTGLKVKDFKTNQDAYDVLEKETNPMKRMAALIRVAPGVAAELQRGKTVPASVQQFYLAQQQLKNLGLDDITKTPMVQYLRSIKETDSRDKIAAGLAKSMLSGFGAFTIMPKLMGGDPAYITQFNTAIGNLTDAIINQQAAPAPKPKPKPSEEPKTDIDSLIDATLKSVKK